MIWQGAGAHGTCPEEQYPIPEFAALAGGDWVNRVLRALAALEQGLYNPIVCFRAAHVQLQSPPGNVFTFRTGKLQHQDTCRLTVPHAIPWHGHRGPHHPFPDNDDPWPAAVQECLNKCADEHLHYRRREQGPSNHPGWRDALVHLFHTTGTRDPRLRLIHPTTAKQDAHAGPQVTLGGHWGLPPSGHSIFPHAGGGIPPTGGPPVHPPRRTRGRGAPSTQCGCGVARAPTPTAPGTGAGVAGNHRRPMRPGDKARAAPDRVGDSAGRGGPAQAPWASPRHSASGYRGAT